MTIKVKFVYLIYALIVLVAVISAAVSYTLIRDIIASKASDQPIIPQTTQTASQDVAAPYPTRSFGIPLPGANTEVVNAFWNTITKKAVMTDSIDITNCHPNPQIAGFILNKPLHLTNLGESPVTLRVSDKVTLTIPAKATIITKADFGHGYGVYDYQCNGSSDSVGVFVVKNP